MYTDSKTPNSAVGEKSDSNMTFNTGSGVEAENIYSEPDQIENTSSYQMENIYAETYVDIESTENIYAEPQDVTLEDAQNIYEVPEDVHNEFKADLNNDDECLSLDEFDDDEEITEIVYENAETINKEDIEDKKSVTSCETIPELSTEDEEAEEQERRLALLAAQRVCSTNSSQRAQTFSNETS